MRSTPPGVVLAACLAALIPAACGRSPSLSYRVALEEGNPGVLSVTLEVSGVPRDSLTLQGFAPQEILRLGDVTAAGPGGAPIPVHPQIPKPAAEEEGNPPRFPRFLLPGPLPSTLTLRYSVRPGGREGDSHIGYTGRCHGYLGKEFGFFTGREVFLIPAPAETMGRIEVRFSLPPGWSAATPWPGEGAAFRPGAPGAPPAEDLVAAAIGVGRFHEEAFDLAGTRFRLEFEEGIPAPEAQGAADGMRRVARFAGDLFGRGLGKEYTVVVVPRAPTGDEIAGEGWAEGQGDTLSPFTGGRMRRFAERLIEAYARHAPYRTEITRPEEFWLVDGITGWCARRAVAEAGLTTREEVFRTLAVDYLESLNVQGLERDLEKIYITPGGHRTEQKVLSPFTLAVLDRELREAAPDAGGLDPVIRRLFRGRTAPSFWEEVPEVVPGFREQFRDRYVRGGAIIPAEKYLPLAPATAAPEPPAGPVVREITLLYTGKTDGYLENCGCKVNQAGGVARRATEVERVRRRDRAVLLLDAGNFLLRPEKQRDLDFLSREEQALYLRALDRMRYDAVALGVSEFAFGLAPLREITRGLAIPFLSANVRQGTQPVAEGVRLLRPGGIKVAVIGILEPPSADEADVLFQEKTLGWALEDPVETLRREVPALKKEGNLVLVLGRLSPTLLRRVARDCPGVDGIITTEYDAPFPVGGKAPRGAYKGDAPGFLGRTLIAGTTLTSYGLGSVKLGLDRGGRIASAVFDDLWLYSNVPDDPGVREMLDRFYDRVGKEAAAQESVRPPFADDAGRKAGRYAGASKCSSCHEREYLQWISTPHAGAYKTLLDRHRHFQPKCVSCHVVGFGAARGFRIGDPESLLAGVQCEVCHGPGADHADAPSKENIRRRVPEAVCLECHTPDHSDRFVYAERLPKVLHLSAAAEAPPPPPGGAKRP